MESGRRRANENAIFLGLSEEMAYGATEAMPRKASLITGILSLFLPSCAMAASDCYDVWVVAHAADQVPTEIGDCGEGCIIMSWPWFVDLKISRVADGSLSTRTLRVLAVQHTYHISREIDWFLRRNDAGSYNVLSLEDVLPGGRCPSGSLPAKSYISPGEGQTLGDLYEKGLQRYGHFPRRDP